MEELEWIASQGLVALRVELGLLSFFVLNSLALG